MVYKMFAVYDSKLEAYLRPFVSQTKGLAIRGLVDAVNDPSTEIGKYPGDYTLFEIGEYDDHDGNVRMYDHKVNCGVAVEFVKVVENKNVRAIERAN